MNPKNLNIKSYISEEQIQQKVRQIGEELTAKFKGQKVVAICVLKGSFLFYSDLIRRIDTDITCEFFGVSSYNGETSSSGEVKVTLDLSTPIEGQHVILVEDIVDTGKTLSQFLPQLINQQPASLKIAALLHKPDALAFPITIDYLGFSVPDKFLLGYGLDYDGLGRNLKEIYQLVED